MKDRAKKSTSESESPTPSLEITARLGTRHVLIMQVASQIVSLLVLAILYRLIEPDQFGYLGMILPVIMLIRMLSTQSMNVATVQSDQLSQDQLSTLFWITNIFGLASTIVISGCAPLLAWLYGVPEISNLTLALSGTALVASLGIQHQAILERNLKIGTIAVIRVLAQLIAGIGAVIAALLDWGAWALIFQQYVELIALLIFYWTVCAFRPSRVLNAKSLKGELKFGSLYTLSNLVFYIGQNLDKLLLAFFLGQTEAGRNLIGLYTQAYNQMIKFVFLVTSPISGVMLPALSRAKSDSRLYEEIVKNFYRLIAILLLPCGVGLMLVGEEAFLVLGGGKWRFAGQLLQALSPIIFAQGFINIAGSVFAGKGKSGFLLLGSIVIAVVLSITFFAGFWLGKAYLGNIESATLSMAWSYSITTAFLIGLPYLIYCFRTCEVDYRVVLSSIAKPICFSIVMGAIVFAVDIATSSFDIVAWIRLTPKIAIGVLAYVLIAKDELKWFVAQYFSQQQAKTE